MPSAPLALVTAAREGTISSMSIRRLLGLAFMLALAGSAAPARAAAPSEPGGPAVIGLRSWSAPENTRLVLDFSAEVTPVAPDSGEAASLVVAIPVPGLERGPGVPAVTRVGDGVVDSVRLSTGAQGGRLEVWFHERTTFHVMTLQPDQDQPFRLVVDAAKPGAAAAEAARLAAIARAKAQTRTRIVAVDAGHGGEDPGARGPHGVVEKRVTLAVARALVAELNRMPGVQGVLTRDGDYFIPLHDRYRIAERMKADVFISIHANSSRRWTRRDHGSEVYFLSLTGASDQADRDLADLENAADLIGGVPKQAEDDLVNILYDVKRTSALERSQLLAESLLDNMAADRRLQSRGVKQAGFAVLKSVEFPSVLVETAFINNPAEAKLLANPDFQRQMGHQLAIGVKEFFGRSGIGLADPGAGGEPASVRD
jgi:N-acetylmuramoyl-L-alanine amidase